MIRLSTAPLLLATSLLCLLLILSSSAGFSGAVSFAFASSVRSAASPAGPKTVWSIGIFKGTSPFTLHDPEEIHNPVLTPQDVTDIRARVVADPFIFRKDSTFYMFFEALNDDTNQGDIGLAESPNGTDWTYRQIVLDEAFHIGYPYIVEWKGEIYMIPETFEGLAVRLYRATDFPVQWKYERDLVEGHHFVDPSLIQYNGLWWMFLSHPGNETLRLYHAQDLLGPWAEHLESPVIEKDKDIARPGGHLLVLNDRLYRLGQDGFPKYGSSVSAFEVSEISLTTYRERPAGGGPLVQGTGKGWNADGMHHVDAHEIATGEWLAAVDGVTR